MVDIKPDAATNERGRLDVSEVDWILDAAAVADHVGISRDALRSAHMRAAKAEGKPAPGWWKKPLGRIAGAQVWDLRDAEAMRVAYAEWQRDNAERAASVARRREAHAAKKAAKAEQAK